MIRKVAPAMLLAWCGVAAAGTNAWTTGGYLGSLLVERFSTPAIAQVHGRESGAEGRLRLRLEVFDGDNGLFKGSTDFSLAPGQWTQFNRVLGADGVANGYVRIARLSGADGFLANGVVNDGGDVPGTNDGSYVAMQGDAP